MGYFFKCCYFLLFIFLFMQSIEINFLPIKKYIKTKRIEVNYHLYLCYRFNPSPGTCGSYFFLKKIWGEKCEGVVKRKIGSRKKDCATWKKDKCSRTTETLISPKVAPDIKRKLFQPFSLIHLLLSSSSFHILFILFFLAHRQINRIELKTKQ